MKDKKTPEISEKEELELLRQRMQNNKRPGGPGGPGPRGPHGAMIKEKPKNAGKTIKRLIAYIGKSKFIVISLIAIVILVTLLSLAAPALQKNAIDAISFAGENGVRVDFEKLTGILIILCGVYALTSGLNFFSGILAANLSQKTVYNMRNDLFAKISYLPIKFTDTHRHGDIMSRMTNDVENISNTISQSVSSLFSGVIMLVGAISMMLYYSPIMTVVAVVTVPLTVVVSGVMSKFMRKYFVRQQKILGSINAHSEEMVTGYKTVMAYGKEKEAREKFKKLSTELRTTGIKANIAGGVMGPLMNFIHNLGFLLVALTGGILAIKGTITVGTIQSFIQYSKQLSRPINEIANQYAAILTAIAGAERVFEIMDAEIESDPDAFVLNVEDVKGNIRFDDVCFSYVKDEPVIKNFTLDVKQGQRIAIVGRTGSGKTTLVNLLTRFYEVDSGSISIDGVDIKNYTRQSLRKSIAIVLQDTILFSDTIRSNIKYGKLEASDEEMKKAAATANADIFIERLPEDYNTVLAESGRNLSQGQRQLLSISRAVLADPKILILDEATSSVDTRTEMQIQEAMLSLMEGRTSLIIAHRLSTIRTADKIIVLKDGNIAESGNHDELLEKKGIYYDLYQTQFAGIAT